MRLERILILFLLLSLAVSCSDNDDDSVDAASLFQIAYGTGHDLDSRTPGVVSFGSDHVVVTNVRLGNDDLTNYKLGVFMVGPTGAVKWSKIIHATEEETLFGYDVAKSSDSEFLILARSGENRFAHYSHPVVIRISASGDVLGADAYDYDLQEVMVMPYLTVLSDASVILSGYSIGYPIVIHSDLQRTVKWSHRPDMFGFSTRSAAFGQQVAHVFTNGFKVIIRKTRDDGEKVWEKQVQLQDAGMYVSKVLPGASRIVVVLKYQHDYRTFLLSLDWNGQMLAFKSINRDFCDLTADGDEYLLALDTNYDNAILRLSSDLEITDQKYIARFFGGSFNGIMSAGESHIAYLIQPMGNDPTVGLKGVNFVQLQKADLTIGCAIEQTDDSPILMEDVDGSVFDQTDITDNIPYPVTITPFGVVVDDYPVEKNIVCQGNIQ